VSDPGEVALKTASISKESSRRETFPIATVWLRTLWNIQILSKLLRYWNETKLY